METLPENILPSCWTDDVRMNALFAPFRLKSLNPESWNMKMNFWTDIMRKWCKYRKNPCFSVNEFKNTFKRNGTRPACLDIVVEECIRNGALQSPQKYLSHLSNQQEGWLHWGVRNAFKPAGMAVTMLSSLVGTAKVGDDGMPVSTVPPDEEFVSEEALKELSTELLMSYPADCERVGTLEELMSNAGHTDANTFRLIMGYMCLNKYAIKQGNLFKLADPKSKVTPITEQETSLHRLLTAERKLNEEINRLQHEADKALISAKSALKSGNKVNAKSYLRRKNTLLDKIVKSESALDNIRHLLCNIRQVDTNTTVIDTYRTSLDALKGNMKKYDEDSVLDTVDELKEVLESYGEIERALSGNLDESQTAELEDELAELLATNEETNKQPVKQTSGNKELQESFVFDGEARVISELNDLSVESEELGSRVEKTVPEVVKVAVQSTPKSEQKSSQSWYPAQEMAFAPSDGTWSVSSTDINNFNRQLRSITGLPAVEPLNLNDSGELHQDSRLHPGQRPSGAQQYMYKDQFLVQDHKYQDGVWYYNKDDDSPGASLPGTSKSLENYAQYMHPDPKSRVFSDMPSNRAPGNERGGSRKVWKDPDQESFDDLERRLNNLRSDN